MKRKIKKHAIKRILQLSKPKNTVKVQEPTKVATSVERYGSTYQIGCKCPACSSEVDKGGRMEPKKFKYFFLQCDRCKYQIRGTAHYEKQAASQMSRAL